MRRILKPKGHFFVVNRQDISSFRLDLETFLKEKTGREIIQVKANYRLLETLKAYGFCLIQELKIVCEEHYSFKEALALCQSFSRWNLFSAEQQKKLLPDLTSFLEEHFEDKPWSRRVCFKGILLSQEPI